MDKIGRDLFSGGLQGVVNQWEEADNFGSLIRPLVTSVSEVLELLRERQVGGDLFLDKTHKKVLKALMQADYLSPKYHVVVANPPYMGTKGMNTSLQAWSRKMFPESKYDLFAMFIERNCDCAVHNAFIAMITMQSWMFLSSYEGFRKVLLQTSNVESMVHLGPRAFDTIGGEVVSTTAFVLHKGNRDNCSGAFINVLDGDSETQKERLFQSRKTTPLRATVADFKKMPCWPIAYWAKPATVKAFEKFEKISDVALPKQGLSTCNNDLFLRQWHETSFGSIGFGFADREVARDSDFKWFPYNKGGSFRKWYGQPDSE